jgi:sec-independent protein translocase protein TatA
MLLNSKKLSSSLMAEIITSSLMQLAGMQGMEWIIVIGLIVAVFFGAKKIPEFAKSIGKAKGEYEKAKLEATREVEMLKNGGISSVPSVPSSQDRAKLEDVASSLGLESSGKTDEQLRNSIQAELRKN